jgi:hypothetical protein
VMVTIPGRPLPAHGGGGAHSPSPWSSLLVPLQQRYLCLRRRGCRLCGGRAIAPAPLPADRSSRTTRQLLHRDARVLLQWVAPCAMVQSPRPLPSSGLPGACARRGSRALQSGHLPQTPCTRCESRAAGGGLCCLGGRCPLKEGAATRSRPADGPAQLHYPPIQASSWHAPLLPAALCKQSGHGEGGMERRGSGMGAPTHCPSVREGTASSGWA